MEGSASCASAGKEVFIGKKFQWKRNFNARCVGWMEQLLGRAWGQGWLLLSVRPDLALLGVLKHREKGDPLLYSSRRAASMKRARC